jgi:HPt (histidine-containing phosphotransfer) domain-containing protein
MASPKTAPPKDKDSTPSVVTFADHEVITPPNKLRKAIAQTPDGDEDLVGRAEAALSQLSSELFRAAHDIRGEAATFGFPQVTGAADSLCRLLEHTPDMARIPIALVDQHVDAVRAIVREHARTDLPGIAEAVIRRLRDVTDEFLRSENSDRPDYLESIFAPPLAPAGG